MLQTLRKKLTYQFTTLVIILILANGLIIIGTIYGLNKHKDTLTVEEKIALLTNILNERTIEEASKEYSEIFAYTRLLNSEYEEVFHGEIFEHVLIDENNRTKQYRTIFIPEIQSSATNREYEPYKLFSKPILSKHFLGNAEIIIDSEVDKEEIINLLFLFFLQSIIIGVLVYIVGRKFVDTSLSPTKRMIERLEQFNQNASHQLKTPLSIIYSSLELAEKSNTLRYIADAKKEVQEANQMIEKMLALNEFEAQTWDKKEENISQLVKHVIKKYSHICEEKNILIETNIPHNLFLRVEKEMFREALMNIIDNAVKFNVEEGCISILLNKKHLIIENTTFAMPKDLESIFERYHRSYEVQEGNGIGLAFVKAIVEEHNWEITAHNKDGDFSIEIRFK